MANNDETTAPESAADAMESEEIPGQMGFMNPDTDDSKHFASGQGPDLDDVVLVSRSTTHNLDRLTDFEQPSIKHENSEESEATFFDTFASPSSAKGTVRKSPKRESRVWWILPVASFLVTFLFFQLIAPSSAGAENRYPVPEVSTNTEVPVCREPGAIVWYEPTSGGHFIADLPMDRGDRYSWVVPNSSTGTISLAETQRQELPVCR